MEEENKQVVEEKKGLSITAMILGIVSVILCNSIIISVPCAILAIVFGVKENKKHKNGFAKSGFILGIISIIFTIVLFAISMSITSSLFDTAKEASDKYKENKKSSIYDTTKESSDNYKQTEKETDNETEWPDGYVNIDGTYVNIYDFMNTAD